MSNEAARIETLLETGQITYAEAAVMQEQEDTEQENESAVRKKGNTALQVSGVHKSRRYSRRGGRAYPEPSDSELDPHWNGASEPLSAEQAAFNHQHIEQIQMSRVKMSLAEAATKEEWIAILTRERKRREQKGMPYSSETYEELTEGLTEPSSRRRL